MYRLGLYGPLLNVFPPFPLQVVGPKKEKLAEAEAELAVQMGKLNEKRAELKEVTIAWITKNHTL